MIGAAMMLVGLLVDALIGWPDKIYRRIGHPVTWLGALITTLETRWNTGSRTRQLWGGGLTTCVVMLAAALPALAAQALLPDGLPGLVIGGLLAWPLIAARSMHDHVRAVATPLTAGDLSGARHAVSMIVGRDPDTLDEAGVARAATESLAENTSDGIVAPLFWGVIFGLPGIAVYKAINTLDSMIGHRNDRYEFFGKFAARLDDVVNWVPARLTGVMFAVVAARAKALRVMWQDAGHHRSPNAGWPEGAMAGALDIRLSGPRQYGDRVAEEPWVNAAGADPSGRDLDRALALYRRTMVGFAVALLVLALL